MKTYDVKILLTIKTYQQVVADDEDDAIEKAEDLVRREYKDYEIADIDCYEVEAVDTEEPERE